MPEAETTEPERRDEAQETALRLGRFCLGHGDAVSDGSTIENRQSKIANPYPLPTPPKSISERRTIITSASKIRSDDTTTARIAACPTSRVPPRTL